MKFIFFQSFKSIFALLAAATVPLSVSADEAKQSSEQVQQILETRSCPGCDLRGVDLSGGLLVGADFSGANLDGADLSGARLSQSNLRGASLQDANLEGAILNDTDLTGANLTGAQLAGSRLLEAILVDANLTSVDLEGARFRNTDLSGATMTDANLRGASVEGWIDVGTVFCRTVEPNGSSINRDCGEPEPANVASLERPETDARVEVVATEFPSTPRQLEHREADWTVISDVAKAQRILTKLGYSPGTVDGLWGARTRQALEQFYIDNAGRFDGSLNADDVAELEAAAAEGGVSAHPTVAWNYRATSIAFGGYDRADEPVYDMIRTIRDLPEFGFNVLTINFRCIGRRELGLPDDYPIGRKLGCRISNRQILEEDAFASTRRDATSLAVDEARAAGLEVNLKPMFLELTNRYGLGAMPVDEFFNGDGAEWSGYRSIIIGVAEYASANGVEYLTIGTELNNINSGIENDPRWSEIVAAIREKFDGKLIYNHNYNSESSLRKVPSTNIMRFVDIVGLNFFPQNMMGGRKDYTTEEVALAFQRVRLGNGRNMLEEAKTFQQTLGVPLILSETTFPTWRGSANWMFRGTCEYMNVGRSGWQYTQGPLQPKTPSDEHGRQLAAGFMLAFEDEDWVHGADYLFWSVAHSFDERTDFEEYGPCSSWLWNSDDGIREMIREFHGQGSD